MSNNSTPKTHPNVPPHHPVHAPFTKNKKLTTKNEQPKTNNQRLTTKTIPSFHYFHTDGHPGVSLELYSKNTPSVQERDQSRNENG